jgi:hypothetical protein
MYCNVSKTAAKPVILLWFDKKKIHLAFLIKGFKSEE